MLLPHLDDSDPESYRAEAESNFSSVYDSILSSIEQSVGTPLDGTVWDTLLYTILYKTLDRAAYEIAHENYLPIGQLIGGMNYVSESGLSAHFPEVSLAWVRALDPAVVPQTSGDHAGLLSVYLDLLADFWTSDLSAADSVEERMSAHRGMAVSGQMHTYPQTK